MAAHSWKLTRREWLQSAAAFTLFLGMDGCRIMKTAAATKNEETESLILPAPELDSDFSLEKAIHQRRSVRGYAVSPLTLAVISQLLWAAQGITSPRALRAAPSAGATYPLEIYLAAGNVAGLEPGVYRYVNRSHEIILNQDLDRRHALAQAALGQSVIEDAPISLVIAAIHGRTSQRYGDRTGRYIAMEAGHAAQNIYLQATALGLGTVVIGAFLDGEVSRVMGLGEAEPLYIMPVGKLVQES